MSDTEKEESWQVPPFALEMGIFNENASFPNQNKLLAETLS
jgi:hypothetical protein